MRMPFFRHAFISFWLIFLCTPQILYSSDIFSVQSGAFFSKQSAQTLVESLKTRGITCSIYEMEDLYKVTCGEFRQESDAYVLKRKLSALGHQGVFVIMLATEPPERIETDTVAKQFLHREPPPEEKITKPADTKHMLIAKKMVKKPVEVSGMKDIAVNHKEDIGLTDREKLSLSQEKTTQPNVIVTQETGPESEVITEERISGNIFERKFGFLHPFLSVTGYYTDNVFNTKDNQNYDYVAIYSPGIWIAIPRIKQQLAEIETSTISPGGATLISPGAFTHARITPEFLRRFQTYLYYRADIEQFSQFTTENMINQIAEGLFNYNFRGGVSIEFFDQFVRSHDIRGTGISTELDKYRGNLFSTAVTYDVSERVRIRADYSSFLADYEAPRNEFRDRLDNAASAYVFYKFQPKTAAFIQYRFINADYDKPFLLNSKEHHIFGGLQWDITAKSKGSIKGGYGIKDLVDHEIEHKDILIEVLLDHYFTPKTSLTLTASRKTNETNIFPTTNFILTNSIEAEYRQRFTSKLTGAVDFSYINDNYKGELTFGGVTKQREDDYFGAGVALRYALGGVLTFDTAYQFMRRDSSFSEFDYINNTIFFRITGSL